MPNENEDWEIQLREIRDKALLEEKNRLEEKLARYEFRPPMYELRIYCSACARHINDRMVSSLVELVQDILTHEEVNHGGH